MANTPALVGNVRVSFESVSECENAVSVFHDVNDNGKLDSNLPGIPVESCGFSNNAVAESGPPAYERTEFHMGPADTRVKVKLH